MTYNVFSGTLNPTHSLTHSAILQIHVQYSVFVLKKVFFLSSFLSFIGSVQQRMIIHVSFTLSTYARRPNIGTILFIILRFK